MFPTMSVSIDDLTTTNFEELTPEEVEEKVNIFKAYMEQLPQKALNLGVRILLALLFLAIGMWIIKMIRKIVKHSMTKAKVDTGVLQFTDSFIKVCLYVILLFMIAGSFGLDAASVVAVVGSAGTLAHHCMADDQRGAFALCFGLFQGLTNGVGVVAVNLYHTPAPSLVLTGGVLSRYLLGLGGELNIVGIIEHNQIIHA